MICILRDFVERELTDHICPGPITDDTVGLQLHWSIIEEFGGARQYLADERDAIIGLHRFNFHVHVDVTGPEQQLTGRRTDATNATQNQVIEGVEDRGRTDVSET